MEFKIPEAVALEHEELHQQLVKAIEEGGKGCCGCSTSTF
jgi:hypothetical protein